jgi:hypothetical protein
MSTCNQLVRNECANFSQGLCIFTERECPVIAGKPCDMIYVCSRGFMPHEGADTYLERAVLPLAKKIAKYAPCVNEYALIKHSNAKPEDIKTCECGKPRLPKHRFCDKCKKKHRALNQRKYKVKG